MANCQIGAFAAYATAYALVDRELYTCPSSGTSDRERRPAAGVPDERTFAAKGDLVRDMILRVLAFPLPFAWGTVDSAYGQDSHKSFAIPSAARTLQTIENRIIPLF
ncbi:transposase [Streptomyces sp. Agncl-13]|uniref:transposase n=1 Tax=Streptomyces sp. Agncl-13 TaxID=3400628 RepID=UPI003A840FE5